MKSKPLVLILAACLAGSAYLAFNLIKQNSGLAVNSAASPAEEPALNQIAFVGNDENVWLVSPDGQKQTSFAFLLGDIYGHLGQVSQAVTFFHQVI